MQVTFNYHIGEMTLAVVASVYPGNYARIENRLPVETEDDAYAEIIAATFYPYGRYKQEIWEVESMPKQIRADIEQMALQKATDKMLVQYT